MLKMLSVRFLFFAFSFVVSQVSVGEAIQGASVTRVQLDSHRLQRSYFSADVLPHCVIRLAENYGKDTCFSDKTNRTDKIGKIGKIGKEKPPLKILHQRFMENVRSLQREGGEHTKLPNNKYALYHEATCTLGFHASCALRDVLGVRYNDTMADAVLYWVSGEKRKYLETPSDIYPKEYDPENYEHFKSVIEKGICMIEKQFAAGE